MFLPQVEDGEELVRLQRLHDGVYDQAVRWFQNLKVRFHNQILQHFGPMPAREADIQVRFTPHPPHPLSHNVCDPGSAVC